MPDSSLEPAKAVVLVVDDDASVVEMMREVLEPKGYTVFTALNGKEGLQLLPQVKPALILLDLIMPVMTGYEFLRHLWAMESLQNVPVVVISGAHVANPGGTVGFLRKPIDVQDLLSTVGRQLRRPGVDSATESRAGA